MLSLVNYGSSGESDDEDYSGKKSDSSEVKPQTNSSKDTDDSKVSDEEWKGDPSKGVSSEREYTLQSKPDYDVKFNDTNQGSGEEDLLLKLPPPVSDLRNIPWDQLSKLTYKSRAIRIMAPEIPEDIEEKKEKKLPSKSGSGLLAMLPRPKNEFVAQPKQIKLGSAATNKFVPSAAKLKMISKAQRASNKPPAEDHTSDSDGETEENVDFFSLSAPEVPEDNVTHNFQKNDSLSLNEIPMPSNSTQDIPVPSGEATSFYIDTNSESMQQTSHSSSNDYMPFQESNDQLELDNEALAALCGSRGLKRKASKNEFRIIDINGSQLTPDAQELLTKNLTADQPRPQKNNKDGPTSQQKRKHQIIYLAHQAKEQELELQNTWANNRMSKKQTQAKYGF